MTVRQLIEKLNELPDHRKDCPVVLSFEDLNDEWEMDLQEVEISNYVIYLRS
jgi:hypothetical protein